MDIQIESWTDNETVDDDTVIRAIYAGLHDPQISSEQNGLLGGAYCYHNEGHIPFELACMAKADQAYIGIAVITNEKHQKVHVYVQPQFRRQGIATRLLEALQARRTFVASGYRALHTHTAERLYERFGIADSRLRPASTDLGGSEPVSLSPQWGAGVSGWW